MKKIVLLSMVALFTSLSSVASDGMRDASFNWNYSITPAQQAINEANAEYKRAVAVKFAWRDTKKMIKKAQKLAKEGKSAKAIALANKAKRQSINAQHQALVAKSAGPYKF